MWVFLRTKFQVSTIILTSFRQGVILPPSPQNKSLKSAPNLVKLYIGITMSMYLALSICVLFISLIKSVNGV